VGGNSVMTAVSLRIHNGMGFVDGLLREDSVLHR
jgi:hypothetical protein